MVRDDGCAVQVNVTFVPTDGAARRVFALHHAVQSIASTVADQLDVDAVETAVAAARETYDLDSDALTAAEVVDRLWADQHYRICTPCAPMRTSPMDEIDFGARTVPGGFFLMRPMERTPFVPSGLDRDMPHRHCFTYAGGGSTIRDELTTMLDSARSKIFVGVLFLGDASVRTALVRAAERLRGGVYIISAFDKKGLDKAINAVDDNTNVDEQTEFRNFQELTRRGIYVRGYPGLHRRSGSRHAAGRHTGHS
jgi:hypothetical protein